MYILCPVDKYMQINEGKFMQNGKCGYVLKPDFLLKGDFNPFYTNCPPADEEPLIVTLKVCFIISFVLFLKTSKTYFKIFVDHSCPPPHKV